MPVFKSLDGLRLDRPAAGAMFAGFGMREHPLLRIPKLHTGVDFEAAAGEPVKAAARGRVAFAERAGELGNLVRIDHGGGVVTAYAHLSQINVRAGDCVGQGAVVGSTGSTGLSAGPHVHFEVLVEGTPVDPAPYIAGMQK